LGGSTTDQFREAICGWATRLASQTLYPIIALMLVAIAGVLAFGHDPTASGAMLTGRR
jgi:hypothetical protein